MRARDIKPGFYTNEQLAECSFAARLLYPGLWMLADRLGRLEYRPKRIKAELLPFDVVDVTALLDELEVNGLIRRYSVDAKEYLWIPAFLKHQRPHSNEKPSVLPPCPEEGMTKASTSCDQGEKNLSPREEVLRPSSLTPSSLTPDTHISPVESLENEEPARAENNADEDIYCADEPSIDFQELRQFWDEHFRPEGPLSGFAEYKQLRAARAYPGDSRIYEDLKSRIDCQFWNQGFAPSLAKYLRERTWRTPPKARAAPEQKSWQEREDEGNFNAFIAAAKAKEAARARGEA